MLSHYYHRKRHLLAATATLPWTKLLLLLANSHLHHPLQLLLLLPQADAAHIFYSNNRIPTPHKTAYTTCTTATQTRRLSVQASSAADATVASRAQPKPPSTTTQYVWRTHYHKIIGVPAHKYNRKTAIRFWRPDFSCGAGAISSPVRDEHFKNASQFAVASERLGSFVAARCPQWLLLSMVAVVTREVASRQVKESLLPQVTRDREASSKAAALSATLRRNLDSRVTRVLGRGGFGDGLYKIVSRFLEEEKTLITSKLPPQGNSLDNLRASITDIVNGEISTTIREVIELELTDRIQVGLGEVVQMNATDSTDELATLLALADKNNDGEITVDELYELLVGAPLEPTLGALASEWAVLKAPQRAANRWDYWNSLFWAPWIGRASRLMTMGRSVGTWVQQMELGRRLQPVPADQLPWLSPWAFIDIDASEGGQSTAKRRGSNVGGGGGRSGSGDSSDAASWVETDEEPQEVVEEYLARLRAKRDELRRRRELRAEQRASLLRDESDDGAPVASTRADDGID